MMKAIERCIVYLAQTSERGIHYKPNGSVKYEAYSDADWQVAHSTATGTCHCVGGRVVHASSKRQQSISISTSDGACTLLSYLTRSNASDGSARIPRGNHLC